MKSIAAVLALSLTGCATTLDPNYVVQMEAYRLTISGQHDVEVAKARAEEARYAAMAHIANNGGPQAAQMAVLALALGGRGEWSAPARATVLPNIPETQEDRALKWAAVFAGPVTAVATGYFGYRMGVTQSNNAASTTIASYNAFAATAGAGLSAVQNVAGAGFVSNQNIAGAGINAVQNVAGGAFDTVAGVTGGMYATLPQFKPVAPNVTINGNGVVGNGRYTGDNSGAASNNSGTIRVSSPDTTQTTTTTTTNTNNGNTTTTTNP